MTPRELAEAYLGALGRGDLDAMAGLFSDNETRRPSWHADQSGH